MLTLLERFYERLRRSRQSPVMPNPAPHTLALSRRAARGRLAKHERGPAIAALQELGALDIAASLIEPLGSLERHWRIRACEVLNAVGETLRAKRAIESCPRDDRTIRLRHMLDLEEPGLRLLPSGAVDQIALDRAIVAGLVGPSQLVRWCSRRPYARLKDAELQLRIASCHFLDGEPELGRKRFRRYLKRFGLTGPDPMERMTAHILNRFSFPTTPRSRSGPTTVTIIMCARNAADTIDYAIRSVVSQTYSNIELLVADDASTDDTMRIARHWSRADSRIRCFQSERPQGPYNLRNALLAHSRGSLVTFHDADDFALPHRIDAQVASMNAQRVATIGNWLRIEPTGRFPCFLDGRSLRLAVVSLMVRRTAIRTARPFRPVLFGADHEFLQKLRRDHPNQISRTRIPLLLGSWQPGSLTRTTGSEALESGYRSATRRAYSEYVARHCWLDEPDENNTLSRLGIELPDAKIEPVD